MPVVRILEIAMSLAEVLGTAHVKRIFHRSSRPSVPRSSARVRAE